MNFGDAFYNYPTRRDRIRWWFGDRWVQIKRFFRFLWWKISSLWN